MEYEYKIEIIMTPHFEDNPLNPFFWAILQYSGSNWINTGYSGWAKTTLEAWEVAVSEYNKWIKRHKDNNINYP
jgi:hypothetical protein